MHMTSIVYKVNASETSIKSIASHALEIQEVLARLLQSSRGCCKASKAIVKLPRLLWRFKGHNIAYKVMVKHFLKGDFLHQLTRSLTCLTLCEAATKFAEARFSFCKVNFKLLLRSCAGHFSAPSCL